MPDIKATDINNIQNKVENILGTGSASFGYGQTVLSSDVTAGQIITKDQWDAVRFDLYNVLYHQTGTPPGTASLVQIAPGQVIDDDAGEPLQNYDFQASNAENNRFDVGLFTLDNNAATTGEVSVTFSSAASAELTVTFPTSNDARYFFNSGGKIRLLSKFTPTGSDQQSTAWQTFLGTIGDRDFTGQFIAATGWYNLTNSYIQYFQSSNSTPYSANNYRLEAKTDVANNSTGTARILTIKISLNDSYADPGPPAPGDSVSGKVEIIAKEIKATGTLAPSGDPFAISGPTYSFSGITTS